jgi:hypothetical protein
MKEEYNKLLAVDGWEIYPVREISGKPVFGYRKTVLGSQHHLEDAEQVAGRLSGSQVAQQIRRMREAIERDPELAIGTAKEFLESLCKTILAERGVTVAKNEDFPALVKLTVKSLPIVPQGIADQAHVEKTVTILLNNLASVGHQLAEIRNQFGTGHGKANDHVGLLKSHARLAVGSAATLGVFLYECHEANPPELEF